MTAAAVGVVRFHVEGDHLQPRWWHAFDGAFLVAAVVARVV